MGHRGPSNDDGKPLQPSNRGILTLCHVTVCAVIQANTLVAKPKVEIWRRPQLPIRT